MLERSVLGGSRWFEGLDAAALTRIAAFFDPLGLPAHAAVYAAGDPADAVYLVLDGALEMTLYDGDQDRISHVGFLGPGDFFGLGEVFFDEYYLSVAATVPSRLARMGKHDFFDHVLAEPVLERRVLRLFAELVRNRTVTREWEPHRRFEYFVCHLCERYGTAAGAHIAIALPLTHERIAFVLNLSREYVSRQMARLRRAGALLPGGPGLVVGRAWYEAKAPGFRHVRRRYLLEALERSVAERIGAELPGQVPSPGFAPRQP